MIEKCDPEVNHLYKYKGKKKEIEFWLLNVERKIMIISKITQNKDINRRITQEWLKMEIILDYVVWEIISLMEFEEQRLEEQEWLEEKEKRKYDNIDLEYDRDDYYSE